eukprot:scaffold2248_cov133-Isochrysis_galbana.AAC.15
MLMLCLPEGCVAVLFNTYRMVMVVAASAIIILRFPAFFVPTVDECCGRPMLFVPEARLHGPCDSWASIAWDFNHHADGARPSYSCDWAGMASRPAPPPALIGSATLPGDEKDAVIRGLVQ